jgi:hypothetical protein
MKKLNPAQEQLLRKLVAERRPVALDSVDGRFLRALRGRGLVVVRGRTVVPTGAALATLGLNGGEVLANGLPPRQPAAGISDAQEDLLWSLVRRGGPVLADHLDGRVLRGLLERGYVEAMDGQVAATDDGRTHLRELRKRRLRGKAGARAGRAAMLYSALDLLEQNAPIDAEVQVGRATAYLDDVLLALRAVARQYERTG